MSTTVSSVRGNHMQQVPSATNSSSFLFRDVNIVQQQQQQKQQQQNYHVNNTLMRPLHTSTSSMFSSINTKQGAKSVNNFEPRMDINGGVNGVKRKSRSSPSNDDMSPAKCLKVNTNYHMEMHSTMAPQAAQQHFTLTRPVQQLLPKDEVITPGSATNIDIQHFDRLAIDLVEADIDVGTRFKNTLPVVNNTTSSINTTTTATTSSTTAAGVTTTTTTASSATNNNNSIIGASPQAAEDNLDDSYDGYDWLGNGPSAQFFPLSFLHTSPRSPFESDDEDLPEVERLRRENEELRKKLAAVSQIAIDTILNQPKVSEVGMTSDQLKQSRKEAVAAVAAACGISKSRAQKEAKRRWLEGKDNEDLVHHYKVTTNNKTKRTIIGILKKRNEIDLVKDLKKDLKKKELDA